ncbi:GIY-YIG nuclease family protein [Bacillus sp. 22475]|uniref:GIY-YIG nuclease family protein n=1 Tax=Bacillus TaxID=1386 RepID=UPI000B44121C|nr:GIY-YIG nuclease family protein [Bacillus thuringiensis]MBZ3765704.1 GIY-YIG nuclease family protein [Bacillus cereus]MDA2518577.1 GIY-YIG nuclease family protein [Bacillus cereus]OTY08887.1 excinuclease ABC [Bacillus thuringiensis serovar kim]OUB21834.1 excinuclease ABC [Bacillus thuringiensis serovar xiaguangiensis]PFK92459.1 excinuclease ABC [Bacillus thuringiensis]
MGELQFISLKSFRNNIKTHQSGVYLLNDKNGRVIYVGQAVDLRRRINAHFNGETNTNDFCYLFEKVAYILEESSIKRSLLEMEMMLKYKTVFNKEVQEEYPDLYNEYIQENCNVYKQFDTIQDSIRKSDKEQQKTEALKREKLRKDLINMVGGKAVFYDIISYLDNGYNPHFLASSFNISSDTIKEIQKIRKYLRIPKTHKRTVKHVDLIHAVTGKEGIKNERLNHLL